LRIAFELPRIMARIRLCGKIASPPNLYAGVIKLRKYNAETAAAVSWLGLPSYIRQVQIR